MEAIPSHGREQSISIRIPPFGGVFFKSWGKIPEKKADEPEAGEKTPEEKPQTGKKSAEKEKKTVKKSAAKKTK